MGQCLTYCVAYNLVNLYLRQLYHLGAIICPRNFMPYSYQGVYLSVVTLKGIASTAASVYVQRLNQGTQNSSYLRGDNLSPLLRLMSL